MSRRNYLVALLITASLLSLFADISLAGELANADRAKQFWKALAAGDTSAAKAFYAPKVVLKAGSELLKKQWGVAKDSNRAKDLLVSRGDLLQGYDRMIDQIGKEKWTRIFGAIDQDKIQVSTTEEKDQPFEGAQRGDTLLKVATGPGDDALYFILRKNTEGELLVHLEATDY